jgi:2-polyprenyl-3-methyl-5-hydroxy-6-metoxy-1,4-benzoquinol methylase
MSAKTAVLSVDFTPLNRARQLWQVVRCPDCTCCFYEGQVIQDYADDEMLTRGRAALYLQQGAGLAQLFRPIARIGRPPGSRYLDIGCGFGFGLDFARRALGWDVLGIDPALAAGIGRDRLSLPIEQRMLSLDEPELARAFDVVMAAETLEHVPSPPAFLAILASALVPGGVLMLTTPDAEALQPQTPPGQLTGILSPELHIVFQSTESLRMLLRQAGFTHVQIERDGGSLVATASTSELPQPLDEAAFRAAYRFYLEQRSTDFAADDDLFWGLAGRGLLESVNDGDRVRADRLRARLEAACLARYGLDLDAPRLADETRTCTLERMAALMPLNLAVILFADAMLSLTGGADRPSQTARLEAAAEAAKRLRRAVGELAMEDALSEDIGWIAAAEALLCAASDPAQTGVAERLAALPQAPGDANGDRRAGMVARVFVTLINAGAYDTAKAVLAGWPALQAKPPGLGRDAVFCRAILALQPGGDAAVAAVDFAWVHQSDGLVPASDLGWAALRGEIQAYARLGKHDMANALRRETIAAAIAAGGEVPQDLTAGAVQD